MLRYRSRQDTLLLEKEKLEPIAVDISLTAGLAMRLLQEYYIERAILWPHGAGQKSRPQMSVHQGWSYSKRFRRH